MRKKWVFFFLVLLFFPSCVNAKEYCRAVSGSGRELGDEIVCGDEHFYVLENKDDKIRMLAKYNLYTGVVIYKEKIEKSEEDTRTDFEYCSALAREKGGYVKSDAFYTAPGYCFYAVDITSDHPVQREEAKSAHWDKDLNYLYPQVGDTYMGIAIKNDDTFSYREAPIQENTYFYDFDINMNKDSGLADILKDYEGVLEGNGYSIQNIALLPLSEIDSIAQKVSQKSLPLKEWGDNLTVVTAGYGFPKEVHFGDLKEYIPEKYSWLYSTTYWNSTVYATDNLTMSGNQLYESSRYFVFVASQGKICGAGWDYCAPTTQLGCGVRPVITIDNELLYLIKTKSDHGIIEVVDSSIGGDTIEFKVVGEKGYQLDKLVITTDSLEKVEFSNGESLKSSDGIVSIDKNKFVMPFDNVSIEALWVKEDTNSVQDILTNPETGDKIFVVVLVISLSFWLVTKIYFGREKEEL